MAKHKRNVWDELLEVGRRILKEIEDSLDPSAHQPREPARVPVPIPVDKRRAGYRQD